MVPKYFFNFDKLNYVQGKRPKGCVLCHIINSNPKIPDLTILKSELFYAAVNLYPYNPGHIIIFPKRHIVDIRELSDAECLIQRKIQNEIINAIERRYSPSGFNIGYNLGEDSGASIAHIHMHIIPRFPRELGMADILAGKRLLVESPFDTKEKLKEELSAFHI